ncbi:hypothetical protein [Bdellovibrio sp. HCB209]|uniref:hypothetical protein n=1 Tax=Bdellovibrio sp. HCB209 TaxID=3394354 RepID=UPI0039B53402
MKNLVFAISALFISFNSQASSAVESASGEQNFACYVTQENEIPTDRKDVRYLLHLDSAGGSFLKYQKLTPHGYGRPHGIYGCDNARVQKNDSEAIILECANDGEEGSLVMSLPNKTGEIYFWAEKMGYGERTLLQVQCEEVE